MEVETLNDGAKYPMDTVRASGEAHILSSKRTSECPHCGLETHDLPDAQRRITELEAQVSILTSKATSAVEKLADYEDKLGQLNTANQAISIPPLIASKENKLLPPVPSEGETSTLNKRPSTTERFFSFSSRKGYTPKLPPSSEAKKAAALQKQALVTAREHELTTEIMQERSKRQEAEEKATRMEEKVGQMNVEIEELSSTLFQQANEMVATERKARAKLEERVKVLENRDIQKRQRLETLETEMRRIERLRKIHLQPRTVG